MIPTSVDKTSNSKDIKKFLKHNLRSRQWTLDEKFYCAISELYDQYPITITGILDNLSEIRYWTDYFRILYYSKNDQLNDYIYEILVRKLMSDMVVIKLDGTPSTLSRYLPGEKCEWAKEIRFIDNLIQRIYPYENRSHSKKLYRQMKSSLNKELKSINSLLSAKRYDEIDFKNMSYHTLLNKYKIFIKYQECYERVVDEFYNRYENMDMVDLVGEMIDRDDPLLLDILNAVWSELETECEKKERTFVIATNDERYVSNDERNFIVMNALLASGNGAGIMIYGKQPFYIFKQGDDKISDFAKFINRYICSSFNDIDCKKIGSQLLTSDEEVTIMTNTESIRDGNRLNLREIIYLTNSEYSSSKGSDIDKNAITYTYPIKENNEMIEKHFERSILIDKMLENYEFERPSIITKIAIYSFVGYLAYQIFFPILEDYLMYLDT